MGASLSDLEQDELRATFIKDLKGRRTKIKNKKSPSSDPEPSTNSTKAEHSDKVEEASETQFMLGAKDLSITWGEDQRYWKWVQQKDASDIMTDVAELKRVSWLEVIGKFDTRKLSHGISYQVSFIVMLKATAQGWGLPVNVRLSLPGGDKLQQKENLMEKSRERWIEILVGKFKASEEDDGIMEISLYEYDSGMCKQGLVIKGIEIKQMK